MEIEQKVINSMCKLGLNEVVSANSGHTGIILDAAPMMFSVFREAVFNPCDPAYPNRDRIVLSAGHGSALLYAAMHLFGFLKIEDLQNFRQFNSRTPGHPEITTAGVDVSTGALGQGFANAVGLALAEKMLERYNEPKYPIYDHFTYCIVGDGDFMEGISYEAASFAGRHSLNKLIVLYDCNHVSLDGRTNITFPDDVRARFEACDWRVKVLENGNDYLAITEAIREAKTSTQPTLIICETTIGYGSPFADSEKCHSNPFDTDTMNETIRRFGLDTTPFRVDSDVYEYCNKLVDEKIKIYNDWKKLRAKYGVKYPIRSRELSVNTKKALSKLSTLHFDTEMSTREASSRVLNTIAKTLPNLIGGAADLTKSTLAKIADSEYFGDHQPAGRNIAFGVREHAMGAITNGLALHGEWLPFCSTFLVFSDYMRYAIRMAAIMRLREIFVFTHDSIAVGEDGTTHEPVEQIESLRLIPNLNVFRPCDANETVAGYRLALESNAPTALILSRQKLPILKGTNIDSAMFGGYIISPERNKKELHGIIIATGSEVELAIKAQEIIEHDGFSIRVVSMPERNLFFKQDKKYIEKVLPKKMKCRLVIEAGATAGWYKVAGDTGFVLGVDDFGMSGKPKDLYAHFGLTLPNIVKIMDKLIKENRTYIDSVI